MEIESLLQYVINNGLAIVLIFYYLKNNNSSMRSLIEKNSELITAVLQLGENIKNLIAENQKIRECIKIGKD